jgi:hypothetical protein
MSASLNIGCNCHQSYDASVIPQIVKAAPKTLASLRPLRPLH